MSVKKKLAATTLAVTVAATAFAGIPLSSKGLAEKLGFSNVAYAAVNSNLVSKLNGVYAKLSQTQKDEIAAVRDAVANIDQADLAGSIDALKDILDAQLPGDDTNDYPITNAEKDVLYDLIIGLGSIAYDPQFSGLEALFQDAANQALLDRLTKVALADNAATLQQTDVEAFLLEAAIPTVEAKVKAESVTSLANLLANPVARNNFINGIIDAIVNYTNTGSLSAGALKASNVIKFYFDDNHVSDLKGILEDVRDLVDQELGANKTRNAIIHLASAYWSYLQPPTPPVINPPIVTPPTDTWVDTIIDDLEEALEELIGDYEDADDEEKAEIIEKALELALEAAQQILTLKASDFISYVDGQAVITLNADSLKLHFEGIKAIQEALEPLDVELALPSLVIDLTGLSEDAVLDVVGELLQQALELGIPSVKFGFDGAYVLIPVNESFAKTLKAFIKRDSLEGTRLPIITKQLSKAYNVSVELDGEVVTHYGRAIKVILPLGSQAIDPDFTTVVKYTDGKLSYENGAYDANGNVITETTDHSGIFFAASRHASFPDISSVTSWAGLQIRSIVSKGIVEGRPDGSFDPQANVTRAEFAKMIVRALNLELTAVGQPFNDVEDDAWYAPYIAAGFAQNVFNGRTTTSFAPNATITRAEMAAMIARAVANAKGITLDDLDVAGQLGSFSDAGDVHETLREGVAFAAGLDLIIGNNGKFNPRNNATRAQAAVVIYRVLHLN